MGWVARLGRVFALGWLVLLWPMLAVFFHERVPPPRLVALVVALVLYVAVYGYFCLRGYRRRDLGVVVAVVAVLAILAVAMNGLSATLKSPNPFVLPILVAGFGLRPRPALIVMVGLTAASIADSVLAVGLSAREALLTASVLAPQILLFGLCAMGLRYVIDVVIELQAAREQIARLAVEQERARISRDLHDQLGHSLSLLTLKGELATRLIPAGEPGGAEVRDMVRLAREALREIREVVSGYRQPTLATELLAARTALEAAGIGCDVEQQSVGAVSRETEAVLGWAIREGVTNVIRHSGAAHCSILLARENGLVRADVVDDGAGGAAAETGSGLRGLGERVSAIGGRLEAGRRAGRGFRLSIAAPADGGAEP